MTYEKIPRTCNTNKHLNCRFMNTNINTYVIFTNDLCINIRIYKATV